MGEALSKTLVVTLRLCLLGFGFWAMTFEWSTDQTTSAPILTFSCMDISSMHRHQKIESYEVFTLIAKFGGQTSVVVCPSV